MVASGQSTPSFGVLHYINQFSLNFGTICYCEDLFYQLPGAICYLAGSYNTHQFSGTICFLGGGYINQISGTISYFAGFFLTGTAGFNYIDQFPCNFGTIGYIADSIFTGTFGFYYIDQVSGTIGYLVFTGTIGFFPTGTAAEEACV